MILINTDSDFPRCCAGAAAPFHQGFTDEEVTVFCTGAGCLLGARDSSHYCFNALQRSSTDFTLHGNGEYDNLRGSARGVDGVLD